MIEEHDCVAVLKPIPKLGVKAGDIATVVSVHNDGEAFTLELFDDAGDSIDLVTVLAEDVRPIPPDDELAVAR